MQENAPPNGPVVDADGFIVCPECGTRVDCSTGGLANFDQHLGKKPCQKAKEKCDKEGKKKKNVNICVYETKTQARIFDYSAFRTHT